MTTYSLWIKPDKKAAAVLQNKVNQLAEKHQSFKFAPHLTLLSCIKDNKNSFLKKTGRLAKKIKPFWVKTQEITVSTTFFQCIFIKIKPTPKLLNANLKAKQVFKQKNTFFMPHISLLYSNISMERRYKISKTIKLPKLKFKVKTINAINNGSVPGDWQILKTFLLKT
jgi:2'-5' RNA ligase